MSSLSPHADLRVEPFSRRGSYMNVLRVDASTYPETHLRGLYLRQCHGTNFYSRILARITLDGQEPQTSWHEARLHLALPDGERSADLVFDGTRALRLAGRGCSLELEFEPAPGASMYPARDGAWEVNARETRRKVLLRAQKGTLAARTDWQGEKSTRMSARFEAGEDGSWEGSLDLYLSTWIPREPRPLKVCEEEVARDFGDFLKRQLPAPERYQEARARAAYVNWSGLVEPCGLFRRPAMLMSKVFMASVWSWDHAFNAMALMGGDPELGWDQMMLMADRQNEHGAFPDAHNDVHEHFSFCKPPIHGWALSGLRRSRPDFFTPDRLREAIQWLEPWTRWWLNYRLWDDDGLPIYLHGNDSGWDNSTFFLKGVPVLTPDLPAFLVLQCRELAALHGLLGQTVDEDRWLGEADRLQSLLLKTLWDGERFIALRLPQKEVIAADTLIETMPLVLGDLLPDDIRQKVVGRLQRYLTRYGPATEFPDSPHYTPDGYWRGPIWAPSTMLLVDGLRRGGEEGLADTIAERFVDLCAKSGFAENYDALSGAPLRDKSYTWTASVFLLLAHQLYEKEMRDE